jgi:phosphoglycerate dehydrogenase-like enzyme
MSPTLPTTSVQAASRDATGETTVRVLVSARAAQDYGPELLGAGPGIELFVMQQDGTVAGPDGVNVDPPTSDIDVAWASSDLFTQGGPGGAFVTYATATPSISWFHSSAAGVDNPRFLPMLQRGVRITNTHQQSVPISEYVLRSALEYLQGASKWREAQERREWKWRRFREVEGTTWLIVGFGAIGADVAKRASAFGAYVIGVRRSPVANEHVNEMIHPDDLISAVPRAEVIVLAAPLTTSTHHIVNAEFLSHVRSDALLINVGRGGLIDEAALIESLDRGVPDAAVLDVTEVEPLPSDSPLWTHHRITITPHNSSLGDRTPSRRAQFFVYNLARFVRGEPLESEVTLEHIAESPFSRRRQDRPTVG